ncbi:MAG: nickel pincer cofactor biosynthesis protein LarB [Thermomicrobiales bacterium]
MTNPDPFVDLRRALLGEIESQEEAGVRIDRERHARTGAPEVIYGQGKSPDQIVVAARKLIESEGRVLVARVDGDAVAAITGELSSVGCEIAHDTLGRTLVAMRPGTLPVLTGGRVGILTAGSSDRPQALEAAAVLAEMGCSVSLRFDMGIAGLHRLVEPLRETLAHDPDALIVAAGMDGVLPGVVSGLVSLPVVALPTSTGYGFGGDGLGALTTMLQTCSPGLAVVNIDNGIGAGIMAGLIANRAASQRSAGR